ncbi:MAG: superfamily phosphohydrolase [Phycisphaerales bacterium]|nr:superfamily phosphohydrolase [Phycisphaerales bacterium]
MAQKIIRDPVHDVVAFQIDQPLDALLFRLLNAAEFQRLRRILQLGMAHLAYPGATHSRYSHSLGVMQTARQILSHLGRSLPISEEDRTVCLVSALLHDLGHGPFSHVFERVSGISHERLTQRLIQDAESDVHRILWQYDRVLPEKVVTFLRGERRTYCNDIIASQLDADRFDYLLRDNLMTGSRYGAYDLEWLLHSLTVDEASDRLAVTWKGVSAVEDYLHSRYNMYRNVYFHKVVRSAEGMVKLALQRAKRLAVQDRLEWPPRENGVYKALLGQRLTMAEFTDLDDVSVNHCFKLWTRSDDEVLARLCRGLLFRGLYKTIELSQVKDSDEARGLVVRAEAAVTAAGGEAAYDVFYDEPRDTPYDTYQPEGSQESDGIVVKNRDGTLTPLSAISPLPRALNERLMFRRLHVAAAYRDVVAAAIA